MSFNRRDILKLFGVGAAVVPLVEGKPLVEAPAQLVTVPEVKILEPPAPLVTGAQAMSNMFCQGEDVTMHVRFTSKDGVVDFAARTFITRMDTHLVDVTAHGGPRRAIPARGLIEWELRGQLLEVTVDRVR